MIKFLSHLEFFASGKIPEATFLVEDCVFYNSPYMLWYQFAYLLWLLDEELSEFPDLET